MKYRWIAALALVMMALFMSGAMAEDEGTGGEQVCDDTGDDVNTGEDVKCMFGWWCGKYNGVIPSPATATKVLIAGKYTFTGNDNTASYQWTIKDGSGSVVATSSDQSITYDFLGCGKPYSVFYTATTKYEDDACVVTGCEWVWIYCQCIECPTPESFCYGTKPDPMPTMPNPWPAYTYKWEYRTHGSTSWQDGGTGTSPTIGWASLAVGKYDMRVRIYYNGALHATCPPLPYRYYVFEVYPLPIAGHTIAAA